jgi:hypothetical protein
VWLSLNQGAEYLVQKYGPRVARRVAQSPPPITVDADGRRGYESSELEAWAKEITRIAAGRGTPTSEATKFTPCTGVKELPVRLSIGRTTTVPYNHRAYPHPLSNILRQSRGMPGD